MLNRPDAFFALTLPEGGVALVPKAQVVEVTCLEDVPPPDPDRVIGGQTRRAGGDSARRARSIAASRRWSCRPAAAAHSTT